MLAYFSTAIYYLQSAKVGKSIAYASNFSAPNKPNFELAPESIGSTQVGRFLNQVNKQGETENIGD